MNAFWKARLATFLWGFLVSYGFTGKLVVALPMFLVMAIGNTILMWILIR